MKTTIELPNALAAEARALAREQNTTLRELMVEGLRAEIERRHATAPRIDFFFTTSGGDGLTPGLEMDEAMAMSYGMLPQ